MDNRMNMQLQINPMKNELVGNVYRHFKGGVYIIVDLAVHSETEEPMVIYKNVDDPTFVWCRPLSMLLSEVDKEKYPDVKQLMRFERIAPDDDRRVCCGAVEKQTPRKIKVHRYRHTTCECGYIFSKHHGDGYYSVPSTAKSNYCPYCGQALDWGDPDDV